MERTATLHPLWRCVREELARSLMGEEDGQAVELAGWRRCGGRPAASGRWAVAALGVGVGLYWLAPGIILGVVVAVLDGWVLLIEILR